MKKLTVKQTLRQKRIWRIRKKVSGSALRPRLCVYFSNKHIYAQAIDDVAGTTLIGISSQSKDLKTEGITSNREGAQRLGKVFVELAKSAGLEQFVFDRHGRPYHGRVKDFADVVRAGGLKI